MVKTMSQNIPQCPITCTNAHKHTSGVKVRATLSGFTRKNAVFTQLLEKMNNNKCLISQRMLVNDVVVLGLLVFCCDCCNLYKKFLHKCSDIGHLLPAHRTLGIVIGLLWANIAKVKVSNVLEFDGIWFVDTAIID